MLYCLPKLGDGFVDLEACYRVQMNSKDLSEDGTHLTGICLGCSDPISVRIRRSLPIIEKMPSWSKFFFSLSHQDFIDILDLSSGVSYIHTKDRGWYNDSSTIIRSQTGPKTLCMSSAGKRTFGSIMLFRIMSVIPDELLPDWKQEGSEEDFANWLSECWAALYAVRAIERGEALDQACVEADDLCEGWSNTFRKRLAQLTEQIIAYYAALPAETLNVRNILDQTAPEETDNAALPAETLNVKHILDQTDWEKEPNYDPFQDYLSSLGLSCGAYRIPSAVRTAYARPHIAVAMPNLNPFGSTSGVRTDALNAQLQYLAYRYQNGNLSWEERLHIQSQILDVQQQHMKIVMEELYSLVK